MGTAAPAVTGLAALAVDCAEPEALCRWWQRLLGGDVEVDDDGDASLHLAAGPRIDFLRVPEPKTVKDRLHLDLRTSDLDQATEQVLAHGATRASDVYAGDSWVVLRDPEGNEFCLLRPRASPASGSV
jgi:catechol 2,3-dioxygenase-like lactoylglutathione lyase family enzyme